MSYLLTIFAIWIATALGIWRGGDPAINFCLAFGGTVAMGLQFAAAKAFEWDERQRS